jgi:hypothetical protein
MGHEGPIVDLQYLGYKHPGHVYLPMDLLQLLYKRFAAANPSGVSLEVNEGDWILALHRFGSQEQVDAHYEDRTALVSISVVDAELGYTFMRPYLPELFEAKTVDRLANDASLSWELLSWAESQGPGNGGIPEDLWVERASRWSDEWRVYCGNLAGMSRSEWPNNQLPPL